jgi:hypothetical protein
MMKESANGGNCSSSTLHAFWAEKNSQMMKVDGLIVINAILAAIMAGIVVYGVIDTVDSSAFCFREPLPCSFQSCPMLSPMAPILHRLLERLASRALTTSS